MTDVFGVKQFKVNEGVGLLVVRHNCLFLIMPLFVKLNNLFVKTNDQIFILL